MSETSSSTRLQELLDDASYLGDELEALKFVIESVPYREKPYGEQSILEMIAVIDHAQEHIYRPVFEQAAKSKTIHETVTADFRFNQDKVTSVTKFLDSIIGHRAALMKTINNIHEDTWNDQLKDDGLKVLDLLSNMIDNERDQLRKVAERVMALNNENGS